MPDLVTRIVHWGIGPGEIAKAFPQGTVLSLDGRPCEHSDGDDGEHDGVEREDREAEGGHTVGLVIPQIACRSVRGRPSRSASVPRLG